MNTKATIPFTIATKVVDEAQGIVEAYVAVSMNLDSGGDVILAGAMSHGLAITKPKGVRAHDWSVPVAKALAAVELFPGDSELPGDLLKAGYGALKVTAQYALDTDIGNEAFKSIAFFGDEQEWSIGYRDTDSFYASADYEPTKWEALLTVLPKTTIDAIAATKRPARFLPKVEVLEFSDVLFGMNPLTRTGSAKSSSDLATLVKQLSERIVILETKDDDETDDDATASGAAAVETDDASTAETGDVDALLLEAETALSYVSAIDAAKLSAAQVERVEAIAAATAKHADDVRTAHAPVVLDADLIAALHDARNMLD